MVDKASQGDSVPSGRRQARGEDVRRFVLESIEKKSEDVAGATMEKFGVSRQAVSKHIRRLIKEGAIVASGNTRDRHYQLAPLMEWERTYPITPALAEDIVWRTDIAPQIGPLPKNVVDIWYYCFTEMFNNALDHSGGRQISVRVAKTANNTQILLADDGVGIFKKIQTEMNLLDERHAILELSKGKLTTDPSKHTGQGIFFTSRMLDSFDILSGGVYFRHEFGRDGDWVWGTEEPLAGTKIYLKLDNHSTRTDKQVFDQYSSGEDYGFNKTVVPIILAQFGEDRLISRSQAKRVLARVELFKTVLLDFQGVESIGQAFADEMFRVFAQAHPELELVPINTNANVGQIINVAIMHSPTPWPKAPGVN